MAEAFGLAASAAGIVSLGLQVYEGIASYVEGVKDRKPELSAISKQANALQAIVKTLQMAAPRIDAILSNNESPLFSSLKTVEEELWALKLFLSSLQDVPGQSSKIASVLKEQKKKLVYPFHQPTLEKLQKRLESANSALQISLQVVNLTATTSMNTTVSEVCTTVNSSQSSLIGLHSGIKSLESSMASMTTSLHPTQASLESMEGKLDLLLTEGRTENGHLETNFQALHTNVGHVSHKMQQTMSMVQISTGTIHEEIQQQSMEIRKLQDLMLRALSQPDARNMGMIEATGAMNRKMITLSQLPDGVGAPVNRSQPALVLGRLLSKPSELKDAYEFDQFVTSHTNGKHEIPTSTSRKICSCHSRTITQQQFKKFWDIYTSRRTTIHSEHMPDCELQAYNSQTATHTRTLLYTGFRKLLSASLELSFSWTSGAGGYSISPNVLLRPMVDETKSPVFRLINLIEQNVADLLEITCIKEKYTALEHFLNQSVDSILKLYRSRECSPYDVNHEGESVIHKWVNLIIILQRVMEDSIDSGEEATENFSVASGSSMRRLMERLSPSGIFFDYLGNSPIDRQFYWDDKYALTYFFEIREVAAVLCTYDNEITTRLHTGLEQGCITISREHLLLWQNVNVDVSILTELTEKIVLELGPLSNSLMTGDMARLQSTLDTDLSTLEEETCGFQTPFHLAALISSPELLKTLLDAAPDGSKHFDTPDGNGNHALEIAASNSSHICRNGVAWELCTDCACSLPFDMLQSNGWKLSAESIISPFTLLRKSSQVVRIKIISMIKRSREELRAAALCYLSPHECQRLQLYSPQVLDGNLRCVYERLRHTDFAMPDWLYWGIKKQSVYHDIVKDMIPYRHERNLAELLFNSGFEDVDHEDSCGETPLLVLLRGRELEYSPELVVWLVQHGARILQDTPGSRNILAHRILRLANVKWLRRTQYPSVAEIIRWVAPLQLSDDCRCACFGSGCTTTHIFFRHLWENFFRNKCEICFQDSYEFDILLGSMTNDSSDSEFASDHDDGDEDEDSVWEGSLGLNHTNDIDTENDTSSQRESLGSEPSWKCDEDNVQTAFWQSASQLSIFLQLLEVDFIQWDHVSLSALRILTFEALEIRHTCCHKMIHKYGPKLGRYWEDVDPICDGEIDEIQEEDYELLCLLDDLAEEFVAELRTSGDTLQRFLIRYWAPRMEGVLEDLREAKMSPEDMIAAEHIGVTWESTSESEEDEESCPPSPTLSERFESFVEEMDEIVATATRTDST